MRILQSLGLAAALCLTVSAPVVWADTPVAARAQPADAFARTSDLKDAVDAALKAKAAGRRVLVVFDIDNTLLTVPGDLGSDAWFAQRAENDLPHGDARDAAFQSLITDSNLMLNAVRMKPTQDNADILVHALQDKGIPVLALTARDPSLRGSTERELKDKGIDLSSAPDCGPPLCVRRGNITPDDIRRALKAFKLKAPEKPLKYFSMSDGVILLQGQDKGTFLHVILHSLGKRRFDDIYFIDDTPHNIDSMVRAAPHLHARVHIYQYERMWPKSDAYKQSPERQKAAETQLQGIKADLCAALSSTVCPLPPPPSTGTAKPVSGGGH